MPTKEKFTMKVCNRLLIKLRMSGIDPTEAILFFGSQVEPMLRCPPNYGPNSSKSKNIGIPHDVWLLRGFYPDISLMFKISVMDYTNRSFLFPPEDFQYRVTVTEPIIKASMGLGAKPIKYNSSFTSSQITNELSKRLEKEVLAVDIQLDPILSNKIIYTPKCISPKGMPLFKLNRK